MRRRFGQAVLCIGMLLASPQLLAQRPGGGPPPQNGQPAPRFAWWRDERYQKHLGLTTDQGTRLEAAWQAASAGVPVMLPVPTVPIVPVAGDAGTVGLIC